MNGLLRLKILILWIAASITAVGQWWQPDSLCEGFESRRVDQGEDYSGKVVSTIIRKMVPGRATQRGVLYIHGFNDYFFQSEMGNEFVDHGYNFYAVDLRKYGRSLLPGQRRYQARNVNEYYPDIDSALVDMKRAGIDSVVLLGHSTGGLIAACFMNHQPPAQIKALILNSPFLDWNLGKLEPLVGLVSAWGRLFPGTQISQGKSTAYSESLLRKYHGEWDYDTNLKLEQSPKVEAGWVRAINKAQKSLRKGRSHIEVPILLLVSDNSVGGQWTEDHQHGDAVLDVSDILKYGRELGPHVTEHKVAGGLHDLVLSAPSVRYPLYVYIFRWLDQNGF